MTHVDRTFNRKLEQLLPQNIYFIIFNGFSISFSVISLFSDELILFYTQIFTLLFEYLCILTKLKIDINTGHFDRLISAGLIHLFHIQKTDKISITYVIIVRIMFCSHFYSRILVTPMVATWLK